MRRNHLYAGTALGLCLAMQPAILGAQTTASEEDMQMFSPLVQPCIEAPSDETCAATAELIAECAEELDLGRCEVLLSDADAVLADPDAVERAQLILRATQDELEAGAEDDAEAEVAEPEAPVDVDLEDDLEVEPEIDAEDAPETDVEIEPETGIDDVPEADLEVDVEAELDAEGETDAAEPEADLTDPPADESDEPAIEAAEPEATPLDTDAMDDLEVPEEDLGQVESDEQPELADADDTEAAEDAERAALEAELREEIMRDLEAERERLRAEADAMADEAPELTVEEAPEDEFVAPVERAREPDEQERATIERLMGDPEVAAAMALLGTALGVRAGPDDGAEEEVRSAAADEADAEAAEVIEEEITAEQMRTSREDFASRLSMDFEGATAEPGTSRNRRDLERAGLAALGALAVGMVINQNRVVARSDERVVVDRGEGDLQLWRDDDAILMQDGSTRRIERYADGSTRSRWTRQDGTEVITVRDATGRVLRRDRLLPDGTLVELIDDTRDYSPIIMTELPPMRTRELRLTERTDPELAFAMLQEAEADARAVDRSFSLRQIRETRELRELLPLLSPEPITFETNRANVRPDEVSKLLQVGRLMERLIANDPREVFLIEGHTDATGPAAFNLALSDRRAESVALALTEFFDIPPENLVVQGYGERYLRIPTAASEERNRRVAIRRITPLITS